MLESRKRPPRGAACWRICNDVACRRQGSRSIVLMAPQDQDLRQREIVGMRDSHERGKPAYRGETPGGTAVQLELRRAAAPNNLYIAPEHPKRMAGAERFHRRFLCGKAAGKVNRRHPATRAVRHFAVSEYAPQEPLPVSLDRVGDAIDIRGVQTESENVRHATASA